jgi:hypothetical protein
MNAPWWIWRPVQTRLTKWTSALLRGARYTVRLTPEGTGYHDREGRVIQANPELFPEQSRETQFQSTQGLLAHEVGHALFTDAWPEKEENLLCSMVNILEDQRIENAVATLYPGVATAIHLVGDLMYAKAEPQEEETPYRVVRACLLWRWAHNRSCEQDMLRRVGLLGETEESKKGREFWERVRPLVEAAWTAPDTGEVIRIGKEILSILNLPEGLPSLPLMFVSLGGIPDERDGTPLPFPSKAEPVSPGLGSPPEDVSHGESPGGARMVEPHPYIAIEDEAIPLAHRLSEALKEPRPDRDPAPVAWGGRYAFRQEVRTPDTPFVQATEVAEDRRSLAIYLLVDRSGSMHEVEGRVRLAMMMFFLACEEIGIPLSIAYFGDERFRRGPDPVDEVLSFGDTGEWPKAMIAGYHGHTGAEYLFFGLKRAEDQLRNRPERRRVIVAIHDGQPVAQWKEGSRAITDWNKSHEKVRVLERQGVPVIGIYLGDRKDDIERMQELFLRLAVCRAQELPDKLGNLLMSLA